MAKRPDLIKTPKQRRFRGSFRNAGNGIYTVFIRERNVRIFAILAIIAMALAFLLHLSRLEWLFLIVVIGLNFVAELFNTALEVLCDRVTTRQDKLICAVKDISSAAVLVFALTALAVGIAIFLPKILDFL